MRKVYFKHFDLFTMASKPAQAEINLLNRRVGLQTKDVMCASHHQIPMDQKPRSVRGVPSPKPALYEPNWTCWVALYSFLQLESARLRDWECDCAFLIWLFVFGCGFIGTEVFGDLELGSRIHAFGFDAFEGTVELFGVGFLVLLWRFGSHADHC